MTTRRVISPNICVRIGELMEQADLIAKMRGLGLFPPRDELELVLDWIPGWTNVTALRYANEVFDVARTEQEFDEARSLRESGQTYNPAAPRLPSPEQWAAGELWQDGPEPDHWTVYDEDRAAVAVTKLWEDNGGGPVFALTDEHRRAGEAYLSELGAEPPFVTLHVRTEAWIKNMLRELQFLDENATESHNYYRNARIETYFPAIDEILSRGYTVVRIGDEGMPPVTARAPDGAPSFIDYATSGQRKDWMDIYLMAACEFMLATTSGPWVVAQAFAVPVCQTNSAPFSERPFSSRDLYIPKLFMQNGRPIPWAAALEPPLRHHYNGFSFCQAGIGLRDNTPTEIAALVREMFDKIDGCWRPNQLQAEFNGFCDFEPHGVRSHMGVRFLAEWRGEFDALLARKGAHAEVA